MLGSARDSKSRRKGVVERLLCRHGARLNLCNGCSAGACDCMVTVK